LCFFQRRKWGRGEREYERGKEWEAWGGESERDVTGSRKRKGDRNGP